MSDTKLYDLTGLAAPADDDELYINDVSDTTDSDDGSSRKVTLSALAARTETLTNKTLTSPTITSPVINTGVSGTAVLDEDDLSSDSDTQIPTQQSVKAYIDAHIADTSTHGVTGDIIGTDDSQTLSNKILESPVINTGISGSALAAAGDVITGTQDSMILTPKSIRDAGIHTTKIVGIQVLGATDSAFTGDAQAYFRIPSEFNGMNLTDVAATVYTAGTTGTLDIQIRNKTDSVDMLSTKLTIDSTETDSGTAATAAVIDTTKDDVATKDVLEIDIDAVQTTASKGLYVELKFETP